jgi:hypothetical protein
MQNGGLNPDCVLNSCAPRHSLRGLTCSSFVELPPHRIQRRQALMWRKVGVLALLAMAMAFVHGEPPPMLSPSSSSNPFLPCSTAQETDEFDVVEVQ